MSDGATTLLIETLPTPLAVALFGVGASAIGWLAVTVGRQAAAYVLWRRARADALARLYIALNITLQNTRRTFTPEALATLEALIAREGETFRGYVETGGDDAAVEAIRSFGGSLTSREQILIESVREYMQLFDRYYRKTGSDEFAALSPARKVTVVRKLFDMAADSAGVSLRLVEALRAGHPHLARHDAAILEMLDETERGDAAVGTSENGGLGTGHGTSPARTPET